MDNIFQFLQNAIGTGSYVLASNTKTMDMAQLLALAAALGWASGIRLYLVVFITGLAGMLGWLPLPSGLHVLQHPAMLAPVTGKGVHFFDLAYERGLNWYRGNFPLQRTVDAASSAAGIAARTFESSPYYLWHPHVAARIAADLDEIRCLVLVRDPVERAYSAHEHETRKGFETETFERALELEASRLAGADRELAEHPLAPHYSHQHHAYRARGIYAPQVERLAGELGKDRVLVVDSQAFFETPETEMAEVWSFLGLGEPAGIVYERHNARHRNPMDLGVRAELEEFFTPHDAELTSWLRRVPSWRQDRPESRPSPDQRQRTDGPDQ